MGAYFPKKSGSERKYLGLEPHFQDCQSIPCLNLKIIFTRDNFQKKKKKKQPVSFEVVVESVNLKKSLWRVASNPKC